MFEGKKQQVCLIIFDNKDIFKGFSKWDFEDGSP